MDEKILLRIITGLRGQGSELHKYEAKSARLSLPSKIIRTLSAFANQEDGGIILLGIGDAPDFEIQGVEDVETVQSQLASTIQDRLFPQPQVKIDIAVIDNKRILCVEVSELPYDQKPCYDKKEGIHGGTYKRVGDQNHQLSPYEIFLIQSNHIVQTEDIKPVVENKYEKVSSQTNERLKDYIAKVRQKSRSAYLLKLDEKGLFEARKILIDGSLSLMATLMFDEYPQRFFPKLRITYLSYASEEISPRERYLDNKTFEGSIHEMLSQALGYIKLQLPESYAIVESKQKTKLQIPEIALREALLNALVHRDYSSMSLSREIQIRLYPKKIEIENPGGLYGGMRVDSLKTHQSVCRNAYLATLLEDLGLMENRGDGILSMIQACQDADLPEPLFDNLIDTFKVTFLRTVSPTHEIKSHPDLFFQTHPEFERKDVIRELKLTVGEAKYLLKSMVEQGKLKKMGRGKGTRYIVIQRV